MAVGPPADMLGIENSCFVESCSSLASVVQTVNNFNSSLKGLVDGSLCRSWGLL